MPHAPDTLALLRLGRLELDPELRAFQPGPAASGPLAGQPAAALLRRGRA